MGDLVRTWWPVLLLVWLPSFTQAVASMWMTRAFRKIDESHPDVMPYTAGERLQKELQRLGLDTKLKAIVTDAGAKLSVNGYHPEHGVIQLRADTHFKRDPMHWAIAAHELCHARFKLAMPIVGRFIVSMVYVKITIIALAIALMFGNVLFALPHVTALALTMLQCALVLQALVLLDEAVASTLALRSLRVWPEIETKQMRSARRALRVAFATYLIHFATRALMLTQWHLVEERTRAPLVPPTYALTTVGTVLAASVTVIAAIYALLHVARMVRGSRSEAETKRHLLRVYVAQVALVIFVYLVWNHRSDAVWAFCVIGAIVPISALIMIVLAIPGAVLYTIVRRFLGRFAVDMTHRTPELERDHAAGTTARTAGNLSLNQLFERAMSEPALERRIHEVLHLSFVPLLVVFWLS